MTLFVISVALLQLLNTTNETDRVDGILSIFLQPLDPPSCCRDQFHIYLFSIYYRSRISSTNFFNFRILFQYSLLRNRQKRPAFVITNESLLTVLTGLLDSLGIPDPTYCYKGLYHQAMFYSQKCCECFEH